MKTYLTDILKRRDLILYLTISGLKAQNKNSLLGYFWWLLDPFLNIIIYYTVVVIIFKRADGPMYGPYLIVGMIAWRWMAASIITGAKSIFAQAPIIQQIRLPDAVFPIGACLSQTINFMFGLVVVFAFLLFFKMIPDLTVFWLLFVIAAQWCLQLAIVLPVAFIAVFVRDIDNLIQHATRLWFFGSPVIWYESMIPERGQWLLTVNPMTHFLRGYRNILLYREPPDVAILSVIACVALLFVALMLLYYHRNEHKIIKSL